MILPIYAYGQPVLRKKALPITSDYQDLATLIADMYETMYSAKGVGLAAPQIGRDIRLFVIDTMQLDKKDKVANGMKQVFINAHTTSLNGEEWSYNEGCLSIPKIREDIVRNEEVTLEYLDENFNKHVNTFHGLTARVILHEYDHIDGKLFIDRISPLKRKLIRGKLDDISKGKVKVDYKMTFLR